MIPGARSRTLRQRVVARLDGLPQWGIWLVAFLLLAVFGGGDYYIRRQLELSILYVVPVSLITYYIGRRQGYLLSLLAAAVWTLANDASGELGFSVPVLAFNGTARLAMFVVVVALVDAVRHAFDVERDLARTDPLTGVANYRAFAERAETELIRARRYRRAVSLIAMDLDGFKEVNDRLGHDAGDAVLIETAQAVRTATRRTDTVARVGGDEFLILLPETDAEGARIVCEKVRDRLAAAMHARGWPVSASFGVLTCPEAPATLEEMTRRADALMYRSKSAGRNRMTAETATENFVTVGRGG
jgi:diguanylate cyclase (GGDEF)-like protein